MRLGPAYDSESLGHLPPGASVYVDGDENYGEEAEDLEHAGAEKDVAYVAKAAEKGARTRRSKRVI